MNCCEHCQETRRVLEQLTRRVMTLEATTYKRAGLAAVVRKVVACWPGPFTSQQIRDAVYDYFPAHKPAEEHHQVEVIVNRMEKQGYILRTFQGCGPRPNIFEIAPAPADAGKCGNKRGHHARNESGFRNIVRAALEDLPEQFTLADLKQWVAAKMPAAQIPYGSWSSTLYKLTQSEELVCVKGRGTNCSANRKVWERGPKTVLPSGEELQGLEQAWADFRKQMGSVETPEMLPRLQRENA